MLHYQRASALPQGRASPADLWNQVTSSWPPPLRGADSRHLLKGQSWQPQVAPQPSALSLETTLHTPETKMDLAASNVSIFGGGGSSARREAEFSKLEESREESLSSCPLWASLKEGGGAVLPRAAWRPLPSTCSGGRRGRLEDWDGAAARQGQRCAQN